MAFAPEKLLEKCQNFLMVGEKLNFQQFQIVVLRQIYHALILKFVVVAIFATIRLGFPIFLRNLYTRKPLKRYVIRFFTKKMYFSPTIKKC